MRNTGDYCNPQFWKYKSRDLDRIHLDVTEQTINQFAGLNHDKWLLNRGRSTLPMPQFDGPCSSHTTKQISVLTDAGVYWMCDCIIDNCKRQRETQNYKARKEKQMLQINVLKSEKLLQNAFLIT